LNQCRLHKTKKHTLYPRIFGFCQPLGSSDSFRMFAAGRMVLRLILGLHGTLVAVSAPLMMPLRDSDIPMNVPLRFVIHNHCHGRSCLPGRLRLVVDLALSTSGTILGIGCSGTLSRMGPGTNIRGSQASSSSSSASEYLSGKRRRHPSFRWPQTSTPSGPTPPKFDPRMKRRTPPHTPAPTDENWT
jgi:hypothetical protein